MDDEVLVNVQCNLFQLCLHECPLIVQPHFFIKPASQQEEYFLNIVVYSSLKDIR
jgi:hypothetical protein